MAKFNSLVLVILLASLNIYGQQRGFLSVGPDHLNRKLNIKNIIADSYFPLPPPPGSSKIISSDSTLTINDFSNWPPYNLKRVIVFDFKHNKVLSEKKVSKAESDGLTLYSMSTTEYYAKDDQTGNVLKINRSTGEIVNVFNYELGNLTKIKIIGELGKQKELIFSSDDNYLLFNSSDSTVRCIDLNNSDIVSEHFYPVGIKYITPEFAKDDSTYFLYFNVRYDKKLSLKLKNAEMVKEINSNFKNITSEQTDLTFDELKLGFLEYTTDGNDMLVNYHYPTKEKEFSYSNISCITDSPDYKFRYLIYEDGTFLKFQKFDRINYVFVKKYDSLTDLRQVSLQITLNEIKRGSLNLNNAAATLLDKERVSYRGIVHPDGNYLVVRNYFYNGVDSNDILATESGGISIIDLTTGKILGYFKGDLNERQQKDVSKSVKWTTVIHTASDFYEMNFTEDGNYLLGDNCSYNWQKLLNNLK